ncbi:hypothetical protein BGZ59_010335 [Podila verticillata]|nr:hypothetical protein BGZ59_010335 [Podila verticillata]
MPVGAMPWFEDPGLVDRDLLPSEFYIATFYISTIGIYFTVSLALIVLFALKIYSLWKASHGDDDDDDDDGSFVIRGHGWLGQPVLRGVTDIHQAARVAGINGGIGDNLGHSSADDWANRVIPKLDGCGCIVSPTDSSLGVRDLKGTFIDSSDILVARK